MQVSRNLVQAQLIVLRIMLATVDQAIHNTALTSLQYINKIHIQYMLNICNIFVLLFHNFSLTLHPVNKC